MTTVTIDPEGTASVDHEAAGALLTVQASLIEGQATTGSEAPGDTLTITAALLEGSAYVDASTDGADLEVVTSIDEGAATAVAAVDGETFIVNVELSDGVAIGGDAGDGYAFGDTITVNVSVIAGTATGVIDAPSSRVAGVGPGYYKRPKPLDGFAWGDVLNVWTILVAGAATGTRVDPIGERIVPEFEAPLAPELPTIVWSDETVVNADAPGQVVKVKAPMVISGNATADHRAFDELILMLVV
jgi:hypothetical protein